MTIEQQSWSKPEAHAQPYQDCVCQKYSEMPVEHCSTKAATLSSISILSRLLGEIWFHENANL